MPTYINYVGELPIEYPEYSSCDKCRQSSCATRDGETDSDIIIPAFGLIALLGMLIYKVIFLFSGIVMSDECIKYDSGM